MSTSGTWARKRRRLEVLEQARACKRRSGSGQETAVSNETVEGTECADENAMSVYVNLDGDLEAEVEEQTEVSLEDAQQAVDDWVLSMNQSDRRMLAIMMFVTFRARHKFSKMDAYLEAASASGYSERTVRRLWQEFVSNGASLVESDHGRYARFTIMDDERVCDQARQWVREHAAEKGKPNMTARDFCSFLNNELLPTIPYPSCEHIYCY